MWGGKRLTGLLLLGAGLGIILPLYTDPALGLKIMFKLMFGFFHLKHTYFPPEGFDPSVSVAGRAMQDLVTRTPMHSQTPQELREQMGPLGILVPPPPDTTITPVNITDTLVGYWVHTPNYKGGGDRPVVMYLHGGGYAAGSIDTHAGLVAELARRIAGRIFFIEYRLAPEYVLPAQTEDAVSGYEYLIKKEGISPKRIAFAGDSAGGGLTLLTLLALNSPSTSRSLPIPAAAVTFSAWTDLSGVPTDSWIRNKGKDSILGDIEVMSPALTWCTGTKIEQQEERKSPMYSPRFAELEGLLFPPVLMQVGGDEVLEDDTMEFVKRAKEAKLDVKVKNYEGMMHVHQCYFEFVEEAALALQDAAEFISLHTLP